MLILLIFIFLINNMIVFSYNNVPISPTNYVPYSRVKKLFVDIYNIDKKNTDFTIEHVIPKFYEKSVLIDDNGNRIKYEYPIDFDTNNVCIKTSNKNYFLPCRKYRGEIARASMYFLSTYPKYKDIIFENVIEPYTILTWHHQYPVSEFEKYKDSRIYDYQGNHNIFVSEPKLLRKYMEEILEENLNFYDNYLFD